MGGGTGTGAAPLIAELARKSGALTVAILIKPFTFEGETRKMTAEVGITQLKEIVDALIEIPNDRILSLGNEVRTVDSAFKAVGNMVKETIEGITELIQTTGEIDISYSDIRTILHRKSPILISTGSGTGKDRAIDACQAALSNPLIDASMLKVATKVLFNITGPSDLLLKEVNDAVDMIKKRVDTIAEVIFGVTLNSKLNDEVKVILFAVGGGSLGKSA
jgi:cell division protein FtsZ